MIKTRLEAFSDGVIAIIITVMVFDIKAPQDTGLFGLLVVMPSILTYLMSFLYLGIYWMNHHHMLQIATSINGVVLWANLHLLFWLSLIPFTTNWLRTSNYAPLPSAIYGVVLLFAAIAYRILQSSIIRVEGSSSQLKQVIGRDLKGMTSLIAYAVGGVTAFYAPLIAILIYIAVAFIWMLPDRRIEAHFQSASQPSKQNEETLVSDKNSS